MTDETGSQHAQDKQAVALRDLPPDELRRYARGLGLVIEDNTSTESLLSLVRERQGLLIELDRAALLDVIVWSRRPVRRSAGKEELVREIQNIHKTNFDSLPKRGLVALAQLRGIEAKEADNAEDIIKQLRMQGGLWRRFHHKRRSLIGSLMANLLDEDVGEPQGEYQFLPEETENGLSASASLKNEIEDRGIVAGIANRLRGAADDYIRIKLDEIEDRIDSKLEEIDRRLGEWRDREVANRLRILRITLVFTVLVVIMSLGYNAIKTRVVDDPTEQSPPTTTQVED